MLLFAPLSRLRVLKTLSRVYSQRLVCSLGGQVVEMCWFSHMGFASLVWAKLDWDKRGCFPLSWVTQIIGWQSAVPQPQMPAGSSELSLLVKQNAPAEYVP